MKLYDAAFDPVINRTADTLVNALVLRRRRKNGKKGKSERSEDK